MFKPIIIHGGMHKAGSSALQFALSKNRHSVKLTQQGHALKRHDLSCMLAVVEQSRLGEYTLPNKIKHMGIRDLNQFRKKTIPQLHRQLERNDDVLFMSGEGFLSFSERDIDELVAMLHSHSRQPEFVFYVRRPHSYADSMLAQYAKHGIQADPDSLTPKYHRIDRFLDYPHTLIKYESVESVVKDFAARYNLELEENRLNPSLVVNQKAFYDSVTEDDIAWARNFWTPDECPEIFKDLT